MSSKKASSSASKKKNAAPAAPAKSAPARKAKPRAKPAAAARKGKKSTVSNDDDDDMEDDEEGSSSDDEESDSEIGLTADSNVKATIKPIAAGTAALGSAAAKPAAAAASAEKKGGKAGKGQKRKSTTAASDDDDDDDAANGDSTELIDVEFGLYDPRPLDYLTLKMLLKDYIHPATPEQAAKAIKKAKGGKADQAEAAANSEDFALHELCDALVEQVAVGSMVKGEGTDEPLGFLSALSLDWQSRYAKHDGKPVKWVKQFKNYILKHAPTAQRAAFDAALKDASTGLLIQNRLINVPPQIVPQLHQSLLDDIAWAQANAGLYGESFKLNQYVMIGRTFIPAKGSERAARQDVLLPAQEQFVSPFASKKKQKRAATPAAAAAASSSSSTEGPEWIRFEEELYSRAATAQYSFPCPFTAEDAAAGRQPQTNIVMLIPHSKLAGIAQELLVMGAMG